MSEIIEDDLRVFVDAVRHYFDQCGPGAALKTAYLADEIPTLQSHTGLIRFSGGYKGSVYFTAPKRMLRHMLALLHEPDLREAHLQDAVGEIANTLAGNARRHFGPTLEVSVPEVMDASRPRPPSVRLRPFVIALNWCGYDASVVVDLAPA